jgi:hypothetical protein
MLERTDPMDKSKEEMLNEFAMGEDKLASHHREQAALYRGDPATGWDEMDRATLDQVRFHEGKAKRHDVHAQHAREGRWAEYTDNEGACHTMKHQGLADHIHSGPDGIARQARIDPDTHERIKDNRL